MNMIKKINRVKRAKLLKRLHQVQLSKKSKIPFGQLNFIRIRYYHSFFDFFFNFLGTRIMNIFPKIRYLDGYKHSKKTSYSTWYYLQIKIKKSKIEPGTTYGIFWFSWNNHLQCNWFEIVIAVTFKKIK